MASKNISTIFPWRCPRCRLNARSFTTPTTHRREAQPQSGPPPESPRFMPPPESVQATYTPRRRMRGILPVPRSIFDEKKGGHERYNEHYFRQVAPEPQKPRETSPTDPQAARNEWKARLAVQRRKNLIEGVQDLKKREVMLRKKRAETHAARTQQLETLQEERAARQDIRLSSASVTDSMLPKLTPLRAAKQAERDELQKGWFEARKTMPPLEFDKLRHAERRALARKYRRPDIKAAFASLGVGRLPDPNRETRLSEMRARVAEKETRRAADRQDALHTLYMHARHFITNETQLDAAIERAFGSVQNPKTFGARGVSVWDQGRASNPFEGISDRLDKANRTRGIQMDQQGHAGETNARLRRIAEELTGGKM